MHLFLMALIVKTSQLPGAGKGLFTTRPIKKGTLIIEYKGEIINWSQYMERVKRNEDGYLFYISKTHCIDAYPTPRYKARYANDAQGLTRVEGLTNNCEYEIWDDKCFIVAQRDIEAGEEIFVDYTEEYWDCIRYNIKHGHYKKKSKKSIAA
jgi:uncharacterized protein